MPETVTSPVEVGLAVFERERKKSPVPSLSLALSIQPLQQKAPICATHFQLHRDGKLKPISKHEKRQMPRKVIKSLLKS